MTDDSTTAPDNDPEPTDIPLCDLDAEAAVLSTLMLCPEHIDEITTILTDRHWWSTANRWIWVAILRVWARKEPIDPLTIAHELRVLDRHTQVTTTYLAELLSETPHVLPLHLPHHARRIRTLSESRDIAQALDAAAHAIRAHTPVRDALHELRQAIQAARA